MYDKWRNELIKKKPSQLSAATHLPDSRTMEIVWTELLSNSLRSAGDISTDILTAFLNIVFPDKITVKLLYREER